MSVNTATWTTLPGRLHAEWKDDEGDNLRVRIGPGDTYIHIEQGDHCVSLPSDIDIVWLIGRLHDAMKLRKKMAS